MNGWSWLWLHNFLNPLKQAIAALSELPAPMPLAKWPDTSSSQPKFIAFLYLGISKPSISSSQLILLHSSGTVALGRTQVGTHLGMHHLGNPKVSAPSGQLQTTQEHHHPAPAQLILHGGRRLVLSGHSQSLQLTGLGKSLPLICQQQPRLNYKRRVSSGHTKGTF